MSGSLFVLSGPSGVGKSTLERRLLSEVQGLEYSVSVTTRPARWGEVHGRDYFFVSEEEFDQMTKHGALLEWAEFYGHRYGTPARFVEDKLGAGRDLLVDVEVEGVAQLRDRFFNAVYIVITPPSMAALKQRLLGRRTESPEATAARLKRALFELKGLVDLIEEHNPENRLGGDYVIINDDLEQAYEDLKAVILATRLGARLGPGAQLKILKHLLSESP